MHHIKQQYVAGSYLRSYLASCPADGECSSRIHVRKQRDMHIELLLFSIVVHGNFLLEINPVNLLIVPCTTATTIIPHSIVPPLERLCKRGIECPFAPLAMVRSNWTLPVGSSRIWRAPRVLLSYFLRNTGRRRMKREERRQIH